MLPIHIAPHMLQAIINGVAPPVEVQEAPPVEAPLTPSETDDARYLATKLELLGAIVAGIEFGVPCHCVPQADIVTLSGLLSDYIARVQGSLDAARSRVTVGQFRRVYAAFFPSRAELAGDPPFLWCSPLSWQDVRASASLAGNVARWERLVHDIRQPTRIGPNPDGNELAQATDFRLIRGAGAVRGAEGAEYGVACYPPLAWDSPTRMEFINQVIRQEMRMTDVLYLTVPPLLVAHGDRFFQQPLRPIYSADIPVVRNELIDLHYAPFDFINAFCTAFALLRERGLYSELAASTVLCAMALDEDLRRCTEAPYPLYSNQRYAYPDEPFGGDYTRLYNTPIGHGVGAFEGIPEDALDDEDEDEEYADGVALLR